MDAVSDGVNLHEESESEQESKPYRGDHSAAIDNSVGSGRPRVGFLLGFCLSSPLALPNSKYKTLVSCTPGQIAWYDRRNQLGICGIRVSHSREAWALQRIPNTYLVRYSLVAFDRRLRIDSINAPWSNRHALDIEADRVPMSVADFVVSDSIRRASTFERY